LTISYNMGTISEKFNLLEEEKKSWFFDFPKRLIGLGEINKCCKLITSLDYMQLKIAHNGIDSLIKDYELGESAFDKRCSRIKNENEASIRFIKRGLELARNVLLRNPDQLYAQLYGRLLSSNSKHLDELVQQIRYSKDRPWLRTLSPTLKQSGMRLFHTIRVPFGSIDKVVLDRSGSRFLTLEMPDRIKLYDLVSYALIRAYKPHPGSTVTTDIGFMPDGKTAISASLDRTIKIWEIESGRICDVLEGHNRGINSIAVSSDGHWLVSASKDGTVKIWDLRKRKEICALRKSRKPISKVVVSIELNCIVTASEIGCITVWDLKGKKVKTLIRRSFEIKALAISRKLKRLYSAGRNNNITVWDLNKLVKSKVLKGHDGYVNDMQVTSDSKHLISCSDDKTVRIWDIRKEQLVETLFGHTGYVNSIAINQQENFIITGCTDSTMKFWQMNEQTELKQMSGHHGCVNAMVVTPDGTRLVTGSDDKAIKIWNVDDGSDVRTLRGRPYEVRVLDISKEGKYLFSGSFFGAVEVWNLLNGEEIRTFDCGLVNNLKIAPDDYKLLVEVVSGGISHFCVWCGSKGNIRRKHRGYVRCMLITPNSKYVISGSSDKTIKMWNIRNGRNKYILKGHGDTVNAVALADDARSLASGDDSGVIIIWDLETGECTCTLIGHRDRIEKIFFIDSGKRLLSASCDGTVKMWNVDLGLLMGTLCSHNGPIVDMAMSENREKFVSISSDGELKLWSLMNNEMVASFHGDTPLSTCVMSEDGSTIYVGEKSGQVHFLRLENEELAEKMKERLWPTCFELTANRFNKTMKKMLEVLSAKGLVKEKITYIRKYSHLVSSIQMQDNLCLQAVKENIVLCMGHVSRHPLSKELRQVALGSCIDFNYPMIPLLLKLGKKEPWQYYANILLALGAIGPFYPEITDIIREASTDSRPRIRMRVPLAIRHYESSETYSIVESLADDRNAEVAKCAKEVLDEWENEIDHALKFWASHSDIWGSIGNSETSSSEVNSTSTRTKGQKRTNSRDRRPSPRVVEFRRLMYESLGYHRNIK